MTPQRKRFSLAWRQYGSARVPTAILSHELAASFVEMFAADRQAEVALRVDEFVVAQARAGDRATVSQAPR